MKTIDIKFNDTYYIIYLSNNRFFGYKFNNDNTIEKIDNSILMFFNYFICSNNFKRLDDENGYHVILDNETNFKHYFKNGSEDYEMFFNNNGVPAIYYIGESNKNHGLKRLFKINKPACIIIAIELSALITMVSKHLILSYQFDKHMEKYNNEINIENTEIEDTVEVDENKEKILSYIESFSPEAIKDMIYSSSNLTIEEKEYLYNQDFFNDFVETINSSTDTSIYLKFILYERLNDLDIASFNKNYSKYEKGIAGFYSLASPNYINILNYNELNNINKGTTAHEFIHLCQVNFDIKEMIIESCAEIISSEYYEYATIDCYYEPVRITKKLMETIGPEPIWNYCFTGSFSAIENETKPYLSETEYNDFINCLNYSSIDDSDIDEKISKLDTLISTIYKNKYNDDITNNEIIKMIDQNQSLVVRYYFNDKLINDDLSYYYDFSNQIEANPEDEIVNEYFEIHKVSLKEITPIEVTKLDDTVEKITCDKKYIPGFKETSLSIDVDGNVLISGYYNDDFISNVSPQELIDKGILLNYKYYQEVDDEIVNKEEYNNIVNNNDLSKIRLILRGTNFTYETNGNSTIFIPQKVYIPPINKSSKNSLKPNI